MKWYSNPAARKFETVENVQELAAFHESLSDYAPSPLTECAALSQELGVGQVFMKDKSGQMGMPSFKILGASWAVFRALSVRLRGEHKPASLSELKERLPGEPQLRLVAAMDGNHGRVVAHMANLLGLPTDIFVPRGVSAAAVAAIEGENAVVTRVAGSYDEAIAIAKAVGARPYRVQIRDTDWEGYTDIPG